MTNTKEFKQAVWKTALTLAHNLCIQECDRLNDNDEPCEAIHTASYCAERIRKFLDEDEPSLDEMIAEAGFSTQLEIIEKLQARCAELERERDGLAAKLGCITTEIEHIISDSAGVAGYHMNGDMAYWSEFDIESIIGSAPQQPLAEHDAEVARKAILEAVQYCQYEGGEIYARDLVKYANLTYGVKSKD